MNPDGSNQVRLTTNPELDFHPAITRDGEKIAFVCFRDSGFGEIYIMNANGTGVTRLTNNFVVDVASIDWPLVHSQERDTHLLFRTVRTTGGYFRPR